MRDFLRQDELTNVVLIGVGNLGTALLRYNFYRSHNTKIVAGFDIDEGKIGMDINDVVLSMNRLKEVLELHSVEVAILTVPVSAAQSTTDQLVNAGIKGILTLLLPV